MEACQVEPMLEKKFFSNVALVGSRWPVARWPGGRWAGRQVACKKTIGKLGVPEKSYQNVAQLR